DPRARPFAEDQRGRAGGGGRGLPLGRWLDLGFRRQAAHGPPALRPPGRTLMIDPDDAKRLLLREAALAEDVRRRDSDPPIGAPSLLARTTTLSSYPTAAQGFYACQPLTLLGDEVEGRAGVIGVGDGTFFA